MDAITGCGKTRVRSATFDALPVPLAFEIPKSSLL